MRLLIVSRTPWDNNNSFGNTFSNLFEGMADVEIYNICCQSGYNNNHVVRQAYQMTDTSVIKSIYGNQSGQIIGRDAEVSLPDELESKLPHKRITLFYICRDIIWKLGRWKSDGLDKFIDSVKPDIIYLPLYRSGYMIDVQEHVIRRAGVPVVAHITDDIYNYAPGKLSNPLKTLYQAYLRKGIRNIISKIAYGEVFAENMADEYEKEFNKPFYLIGKGIDIDKIEPNNEWVKTDKIHFVYTGNYGGERGKQLILLAQAIKNELINNGREACLDIYSTTKAEKATDDALSAIGCVNLCGGVNGEKLRHIQRRADYLVHVEGFSKKAIYETRLSFSTKIIDYLLAQRPIIAIGPAEVNSIKVLAKNGLATVACNSKDVAAIVRNARSTTYTPHRTMNYLTGERDIKKIQSDIKSRLSYLLWNH